MRGGRADHRGAPRSAGGALRWAPIALARAVCFTHAGARARSDRLRSAPVPGRTGGSMNSVTRAVPLDRAGAGSRLDGAAAPALVPLVRRLDGAADPLALYAALTNGGRHADTMLLESADSSGLSGTRSLIVARSLMRLTCRGREVL